ncbi:MAG TPA: NDP-sugar synthase [Actinomycetota bacterium]|nr:NDP-sugar synthase [Actinomycetota bacterium]
MKAVVLVGGEGTRLRPLTETIPKPLVPLVDRPSLDHVLDHLAAHGVHEAILSSSYLEEQFRAFIDARRGDPSIVWITEEEPLGTGGAIVNALDHLGDEPFLALNGDILTDLDLAAMRAFHEERGAEATIALQRVEDARPFGLVVTGPDGRVREFREKPREAVPGDVNAGTYLLDPAVLRRFPRGRPLSIEREVFPALIEEGRRVYGFPAEAYWLDLGTPEKYLQAHFDLLEGRVRGVRYPAPYVAPGARVHLRAHLGRWVSVCPEAVVGPDAEVDDSILLAGARVGAGARVLASIVGPGAEVGDGATVVGSVLAEGARVPPGLAVEGARVGPGEVVGATSAPGRGTGGLGAPAGAAPEPSGDRDPRA